MEREHPLRKVTSRPKKWAQAAEKRMEEKGTKGSLTRIAKSHGESATEYAHEHYNDSGAVGKKARFAVNLNK